MRIPITHNTVTAMKMPECVTDDRLRDGVKNAEVIVSGFQSNSRARSFRIGTMDVGSCCNILRTIHTRSWFWPRKASYARRELRQRASC